MRFYTAFSSLILASLPILLPSPAQAATATTTTLQVTPACLTQGCVVTLKATVVAASAQFNPGLVYFCEGADVSCENGAPVGHAQLLANGTATIKHPFGAGTHHLHAVFHGTGTYRASASPVQDLTVAPANDTRTVTAFGVSSTPPLPLGQYSESATVTSLSPAPPTGTVSFRDTTYGDAVLATAQLGSGKEYPFTFNAGGLDFSAIPSSIQTAAASNTLVADFNNDGFQDILVFDQAGFHVLLGSSSGKFTLGPKGASSSPSSFINPVVADFRGSGKLDIAFLGATGLEICFGNGDGTFSEPSSIVVPNVPGKLYLGDFNNDGIPDLVVSVHTTASVSSPPVYELQSLLGRGDGTFTAPAPEAYSGTLLLVADFDHDGKLDLLSETAPPAGNPYGAFLVLHGNGDGTFTALSKTTPNFGTANIVGGDFNADGIPDVVTYDGTILAYWQGIGDGTFTQPASGVYNFFLAADPITSLVAADFNGDGVLDVGASQTALDQDNDPTFFGSFLGDNSDPTQFHFIASATTPDLTSNAGFVVAPFSSNGLPDLIQFNPGASPTVFTGDFDSAAQTPDTTFSLAAPGPHNIVASYDGDSTHSGSVSTPITLIAPQINENGGFSNSSGILLNGGAAIQNGILNLTDGRSFEAHSAFSSTRIPIYDFKSSFEFQIPGGQGDGFAFVIQSNGPNAIGSAGGGLGYGQDPGAPGGASITNSFAVVFDLHNNQGEGSNSVRLETGGVTSPAGSHDLTSSGIDLHSGHHFGVFINGSLVYGFVQLTLTDLDTNHVFKTTFYLNRFDIVGDTFAYAGFTSSTGATVSHVNILNWAFIGSGCCLSGTPSISVPTLSNGFAGSGSLLQLNNGAAISGSSLLLTNGGTFEATSAYFTSTLTKSGYRWTTDFDFQIIGDGGDGFTFVTQRQGLNAIGTPGGGLGYGPYFPGEVGHSVGDSLAVKFDVHNNAGEGNNSTGFYVNGAPPTVPAINLGPSGINLRSGHTFHARMYSDGVGNLDLSITDLTEYAVFSTQFHTGFLPDPAYVGFTAGTGATSNTIKILNWTWAYSDVFP